MEGLGFQLRDEASLQTLTEEIVKSSEIEGEMLNKAQVRSSIARRLGLKVSGLIASDRNVEGVVEMTLDATQKFNHPLSDERLFGWHAALFPNGRSGMRTIRVGQWRDDREGPMQVVSGGMGRERVHYQAPPAGNLPQEMKAFLDWFNHEHTMDPVLKAGVAHLWFVVVHPFEDGNGRIARAIADMALAGSENNPQRFYSMSAQIRLERKTYYALLEATHNLDITEWLDWFLGCLDRAFHGAESILTNVLQKARFWERYAGESFNDRQRRILNRVLEGLEGKLTSSKWAKMGRCSHDTASRDIDDLIKLGILAKDPAGGRSTSYTLVDPR